MERDFGVFAVRFAVESNLSTEHSAEVWEWQPASRAINAQGRTWMDGDNRGGTTCTSTTGYNPEQQDYGRDD